MGMLRSSSCENCPAGYFAAEDGTPVCSVCPIASYQPDEGQASCIECGNEKTTRYPGAVPISECTCSPGRFWDRLNDRCLLCKNGAYCAGGVTLPLVYEGNYARDMCGADVECSSEAVSDDRLAQENEDRAAGAYTPQAGAFSDVQVYKCA